MTFPNDKFLGKHMRDQQIVSCSFNEDTPKLFQPVTFPDDKLLGELKDVEDKLLKLDSVALCRPANISSDKKSHFEVNSQLSKCKYIF